MTKLRPYLKSSARAAQFSVVILGLFFSLACSSSTKPTFLKEDVANAIVDISLKEYKTVLKTKLVGRTLWVYLPVEGMLVKDDKPKKYTVKFVIEQLEVKLAQGKITINYLVKSIPPKEESQDYKYNKDILEKMYNTWMVLRRVIFSLDHQKELEPQFYYFSTADIRDGFEIVELAHYLDLKKISYGLMSTTEYQHRTPQDIKIGQKILGDRTGAHLDYRDITLSEFICLQIQHRMKLKFEKAETEKKFDIDKEIQRIHGGGIQPLPAPQIWHYSKKCRRLPASRNLRLCLGQYP